MANKNIRSGQILSPFGIGQIINFPEEVSLMVCGLDLWDENINQRKITGGFNSINEGTLRINEPRLQKLLDVEWFVKPFPYTTSGLTNNLLKIPAVRFPQWHYCTNQRCGRMIEVPLTLADDKVECSACQKNETFKSKMIPVRFVAVCPHGHIQDVPFKEWIHNGPVPKDNMEHHLSYHSLSGSGDLGSIMIKCSCGIQPKTLAGLMNVRKNGDNVFDSALARIGLSKNGNEVYSEDNRNDDNPSGQYCKGHKPWLGQEGISDSQSCGKGNHLQVMIRGGSSIHYSDIISALYLPEVSEEANEYVGKVIARQTKKRLTDLYKLDEGKTVLPMVLDGEIEVINGLISKEELLSGIIEEINSDYNKIESNDDVISEEKLRLEEYNYILNGRNSENAEFKAIRKTFEDYNEKEFLEQYFECVVLIEKLKETRVFKGFSRISPSNKKKMSDLSKEPVKWLPAVEVFGEGVFLKFRDDKIDNWEKENGKFFVGVLDRYHRAILNRRPSDSLRGVNASFVMMHTFAHLLIKRLCFSCGYGSSSLRERIYFSSSNEERMNGILIYTSSGDSEGSLGGLVRQGRSNYLGRLIKDSIEEAKWCSADPVCSDIGQSSGQGPDNINGSACHNCCIVPETSCEEFNMLLDRAMVIGTFDDDTGYFAQ